MCGIVGIFDPKNLSKIDSGILNRMNETQFHRGPDEGGIYTEPGIGLGHRRLSIIDLSGGRQPLANEDGSVFVTFNGEIYNYPDLVSELKKLGHKFKTHTDTEVIVHAWEEWGEKCVARFDGMFAFAIWDSKSKTLFAARDRLGKKPFHYSMLNNGHFIFSSELKALYSHPMLIREVDPCAIEEYFTFGYVADPRCIYRGVYKLPPAHTLTIQYGQKEPKINEYWDIPFQQAEAHSNSESIDILRKKLKSAVSKRMISDVPLGAFLSGGVDSSSVVAMMAEISDTPVHTCSISFDSTKYNESEYAQEVADRYHTDHYVENVDPDDFSLVDKLAGIYDEPYADSSAIPTYRVCELARKKVTVALSGDGADEYFSGYRRHQWHMNEEKIRSILPLSIRKPVFGLLGTVYPKLDWAPRFLRAKTTFQAIARDSVSAYVHTMSILSNDMRDKLFSTKLKKQLEGYNSIEVFRRHAQKAPSNDALSLIQYIDLKTYLVGDIHTKVDRASMANSLEVRAPLLDYQLVEWVSGLDSSYKLKGQTGKYILKKAMEQHLPNNILYRSKMGFSVPLAEWFRGPLKQRVMGLLTSNAMIQDGLFNMKYVEYLLLQHQSGARDFSAAIWTLLMYEAFFRGELM